MELESDTESPYKLLCVGCLCFGRTLRSLRDDKLGQSYLDIIKEVPLYNTSIKCPSLCLECFASLRKAVSFRQQVQDSYRILQAYTSETLTELLLSDVWRPPKLCIHNLDPIHIVPTKLSHSDDTDDEVCVKEELKHEQVGHELEVEIMTNPLNPETELNTTGHGYSQRDRRMNDTENIVDNVYVKDELKSEEKEEDIKLDDAPLSDCPLSDNEANENMENIEKQIQSLLVEMKKDSKVKKKKKKLSNKVISKQTPVQDSNKIKTIELTYEEMLQERVRDCKKESYVRAEFKCESCIVGFNYKTSYTTHMNTKHSPDLGEYNCVICKTVLPTVESFQTHYKRHMRRFECGICQKRTLDMKVMEQHYYSTHKISLRQYPCSLCRHVSNSIDNHRYHRDTHKARVQCPDCDKSFTHRAGLMNHRLAVHEFHNTFPCTICNKVFRWKTSLKRHLEKHDQGKATQNAAAYCSTCKINFASMCSFKRHMKNSLKHVAQDQLKYVCDHCNKRFADKTKLRDHIEEKHLHKTYQCHICLKPSKNRVGLDQHIRNVHKGRPNNKMCHLCGKGFPTKVQLESHIRTHTGERPFICEFCPTMFSQQSNLYKHNRQVHLNMKSKRYTSAAMAKRKEIEVVIDDAAANRCLEVDIPIERYSAELQVQYASERYNL